MCPTSRTQTGGLVAAVAVTLLLAGIVPLAPVAAASGPSLSYTVTPDAYNNTVRAGPNGLMVQPKVVTGPDPTDLRVEDVYVLGLNDSYTPACAYSHALAVLRSTDGGANFTSRATVSGCFPGTRVDAVVLANGTLVVAVPGPQVLVSSDGGATFAATASFGTTSAYATLARDASTGRLALAFPTAGILEVSMSADGGLTWSLPVPTVAPAGSAQIAAHAGTVVLAFPELLGTLQVPAVVTSADGGLTFSAEILLTGSLSLVRTSAPSVAVSGTGVFAVAWSEETEGAVWSNTTVAAISRDGGATWSSPLTVGGPTTLVAPSVGGVAAFDSEGRLFVAWHNYSADLTQAFLTVASSDASLDTFTNASFALRYQAAGSNATNAENLAADASGRVFLAWAVNNGGTTPAPGLGVFVRTVTGTAVGAAQAGASGTTSMTITLRSATSGRVVGAVNWTGQAVVLVELPPDDYQVAVDNHTGSGPQPAGTMPVRTWARTSFTVDVSALSSHAPPPGPFPWLLAGGVVGVVALLAAALASVHYRRITRETVLQRKVRLLLYEHVCEHPGATFTSIRDAMGLKNGAAAYHLDVLERQGFLHSATKGRRHFYYPNGSAQLWKDLPLSGLQNSILQAVRASPGIGVRELGRAIGKEPSSVGYNVKALAREGLLRTGRDGLRLRCYPAGAEPAA